MRFVPIKSKENQAFLLLHRARGLLVRQRMMAACAIRAHLAEYGIVIAQGRHRVKAFATVLDGSELGTLDVQVMGRGMAWLDTGTHESLLEAATFIHTLQKRQGLQIASPEETAYRMGYISAEDLERLASPISKNGYGQYLLALIKNRTF